MGNHKIHLIIIGIVAIVIGILIFNHLKSLSIISLVIGSISLIGAFKFNSEKVKERSEEINEKGETSEEETEDEISKEPKEEKNEEEVDDEEPEEDTEDEDEISCKECNEKIPSDVKYCPECGAEQ